ncbi:hypothetical protein Tsubulata_027703 [Turnera subulata]|uniref:RING-type E3 ubiquitin transferase n=1 Tax=Turnera subulata TaxID=218843 RepID=A0A9Q0J565_9ROSI|nr:hypothetical protein Tsubulata_027703 [Turnera subulata]
MIRDSNGSGRRILSFPAVHPCENISPTTLLTSLITLANSICSYKSRFFSSNARNARETIRQVSNLLVLLEEIRVVLGSGLPDGLVLGLSELHLTLQKLHYLLQDCTREGSRLWMLMKSEQVADQFRVLFRAMATGLDVLLPPLGGLPGEEVKEVVELVTKQAREARFEVHPDDKRVMSDVMLVLKEFLEDGGVVVRDEINASAVIVIIRRVLAFLGVNKWSDCHSEVKFLDSEIGFEYSNVEKRREVEFLSSLMGFVCYSRCVLFDSVDHNKLITSPPGPSGSGSEVASCLNSDDFRCPISLEIMKEPVTIETGHTYDRSSILKWFKSGNATCPNTGYKLGSTQVVPNSALKRLIQQYCSAHGIPIPESSHKNRDITRTILAGSLAAEGAMRMVAKFLADRLADDAGQETWNKAAYEIRLLSKTSIFNRSCLVEAGVIPLLLKLLVSEDGASQENAVAALLNLSKHSKSKAIIVQNGGLELVVEVLKKGSKMEARQHAAATLFYLASIEDYRKLIGESGEAVAALLALVKEGNDRGKKNALVAIYGLLMHPGNHGKVLGAGAVSLILDLLTSSEREDLITDSLAVLATLAEKTEGAKAILRHGALPQIVGTLDCSTSRATKEHCVSLLLALSINCGVDVVALLVRSPSLMGSLYSLLSEGTSRASKKASALISILHDFFERSSTGSKSPVILRERFIHVW